MVRKEKKLRTDQDQVLELIEAGMYAKKAAREKMRSDMKNIQAQVKQVLTPDQQTKWQEQMAKHEGRWKDHDGGKAQPESK